jgi:hypothetical protein
MSLSPRPRRSILFPLAGFLLLAVAQAASAPHLGRRLEQTTYTPDHIDDIHARSDVNRNRFHFGGSLLGAAGVLLGARVARTRRMFSALLVVIGPLLLSSALWLQWAVRGLPSNDLVDGFGRMAGALAGLACPLVGGWRAWRAGGGDGRAADGDQPGRRQAGRPVAGAAIVLALLVLLWSSAFALSEFAIGVSA